MKRLVATLLLLSTLAPAAAQQVPAVQTPDQQALAGKLMQEISSGLQCQSALITAQRELEELKKKHADEKPNAPPAK